MPIFLWASWHALWVEVTRNRSSRLQRVHLHLPLPPPWNPRLWGQPLWPMWVLGHLLSRARQMGHLQPSASLMLPTRPLLSTDIWLLTSVPALGEMKIVPVRRATRSDTGANVLLFLPFL